MFYTTGPHRPSALTTLFIWAFVLCLLSLLVGCNTPWTYVTDCTEPPSTSMFGRSLALDGDLALVGNHNSADLYERRPAGRPYLQDRWVHLERFAPRPGAPPGLLGSSVALKGNLLAIGAEYGDQMGNDGYVDLYERAGPRSPWTFLQRVEPTSYDPPPSYGRELGFGGAVEIQGDELFVSAHHYGDTAGRVFVFGRTPNGYQQTHELKPPVDLQETGFGEVISVSGDTLVISRANQGGAGTGSGSPLVAGEVHIYTKVNGLWTPSQVLVSPTSTLEDHFGTGLQLVGDTLVIREDAAVHLYRRQRGQFNWTWSTPVAAGENYPVAHRPPSPFAPGYIFVGTPGGVQIFIDGGPNHSYIFQAALVDPAAQAGFGSALALSGPNLLVASWGRSHWVRAFEREEITFEQSGIRDEAERRRMQADGERRLAANPDLGAGWQLGK